MILVDVTARGVAGFSAEPVEMELPPGSTVATVLDRVLAAKRDSLSPSDGKAYRNVIATLNGHYIPASQVEQKVLATGDQIAVIPFIAGG